MNDLYSRTPAGKARAAAAAASDECESLAHWSYHTISENAMPASLIAFGVGLGVGIALAASLAGALAAPQPPPTWAERLTEALRHTASAATPHAIKDRFSA